MAYSKVILNGTTLMDVTQDTVDAANLLSGETATKNSGAKVTGTYTPPTFSTQSKTVTPSTTSQTVQPDSGYDGLSSVTVNAMPSGSASTPATSITANPYISVSLGGLITATASASQSVTPTVSAGYVSTGTAGMVTVSGSNTSQLTTQSAQTITPTTTNQTIASGQYLTGAQTILGDANLLAENIKKDVSIFNVVGTLEGGGGGPYTVTITLYTPKSSGSFTSFEIYEWDLTNSQIGQKIGEITSARGSTTITTSSNAIWCKLFGGYVSPPISLMDVMCANGIGYCSCGDGAQGSAYMSFIIAKSGFIDIPNIDWDD